MGCVVQLAFAGCGGRSGWKPKPGFLFGLGWVGPWDVTVVSWLKAKTGELSCGSVGVQEDSGRSGSSLAGFWCFYTAHWESGKEEELLNDLDG